VDSPDIKIDMVEDTTGDGTKELPKNI